MERLISGLDEVLDYAAQQGVTVGFEPEPGMLIDTLAAFEELLRRIGEVTPPRGDARAAQRGRQDGLPGRCGLTLDIGHLQCQGEPIPETIRRWAPRLVNVHIEDMRLGADEHLMFGDGEIDFPPVFRRWPRRVTRAACTSSSAATATRPLRPPGKRSSFCKR